MEKKLLKYPKRIGFLLLKKFTLLSMSSAVEPLRMANYFFGEEYYKWSMISETGENVFSSDGIEVKVNEHINGFMNYDLVLVVGGVDVKNGYTKNHISWLRKLDKKQVMLGGICTGSYVLATAGLLNKYACSIHWENLIAMQETFPNVLCTNRLFTLDRNRMTSSGGTAPIDMMLSMIKTDLGSDIVLRISEMFMCERIRTDRDVQKIPLKNLLGTTQPKLLEAAELMEANIEEPISLEDLAGYVNISRRQLERLFKSHLGCSPSKYYLQVRLQKAQQLLRQTTLSIVEVATVCGFISTPHFSKCYKGYIGNPPREERCLGKLEHTLKLPEALS